MTSQFKKVWTTCIVILMACGLFLPAQWVAAKDIDPAVAIKDAVEWIVVTHQNSDGGYSSFSAGANFAPSDVGGTLDALWAVGSGGATGEQLDQPITYLQQNSAPLLEYAQLDGGSAAKIVLVLLAAGENPRAFVNQDFVAMVASGNSNEGALSSTIYGHSLAMLALARADETVPETAVSWLKSQQATEGDIAGSWDDGFGTVGNADATGQAIAALVESGLTAEDTAIAAALDFLNRTRLDSGGWEYGAGFGENVNSTALAIQALIAADLSVTDAAENEISPLQALLNWQSDSGAFQSDFGEGLFDDFFPTVQAVPALATIEQGPDLSNPDLATPLLLLGLMLVTIAGVIYFARRSR